MSNNKQTNTNHQSLKIAVPTAGGGFCEHFGGAREFIIYEANRETRSIERSGSFPAPEHKPGSLPLWLAARHVDAVVASSIGERAMNILAAKGIDVFLADDSVAPSGLAEKCLSGSLVPATPENTRCSGHHDHDDHGHHHH